MKKQNFWALPRLCLCLITCFLWLACTVSRDGKQNPVPANGYVLTAIIPPGEDEGHLMGLLADAGVTPESVTQMVNINMTGKPGYVKFRIRLRNNSKCRALMSRIKISGIPIQGLQIESE